MGNAIFNLAFVPPCSIALMDGGCWYHNKGVTTHTDCVNSCLRLQIHPKCNWSEMSYTFKIKQEYILKIVFQLS